jgi:signal transduction histidine kinase
MPAGGNTLEASHLYRIAQEAMHNAVKHSHASQIDLTLAMRADRVVMVIQDNGTGLPAAPKVHSGMGLQTMKERASLIGATLDVRRVPAGGTVVTCTWPCGPQSSSKE